jgi:ankyrin repeat protein
MFKNYSWFMIEAFKKIIFIRCFSETPLTMATTLKNPSKVLISLVNGGALLDYRTRVGSTAMHKAVEKNSLEAVKTLLELGASPNYKDSKSLTPLYLSIINKTDPLLCESLLHDHATIGAKDLQGWQEVHQVRRRYIASDTYSNFIRLFLSGVSLRIDSAFGSFAILRCRHER